jgi:hypothetical protein
MSDNESFFRKVARFVANPTTDWTDLNSRQEDTRELELEKSELKAMIERKRRNDFVRKREFDMLRKVRREGLSPEQLATLGGSSRLDDSEAAEIVSFLHSLTREVPVNYSPPETAPGTGGTE